LKETPRIGTIKIMHKRFQILPALLILAVLSGCAMFPKAKSSPVVGTWTNSIGTTWMIKSDGTFDVDLNRDGKRDAWGSYSVDNETITVRGTGGMMPKGCDGEGVYHFKRNGDNLSFTVVNDKCKLRKKNLAQAWRLKK
jgi:hypothetical protein